jgi:hypothetical protein
MKARNGQASSFEIKIRIRIKIKSPRSTIIDSIVWKTGNIRYIVDSQRLKWQQNRQQTGNRLATFSTRDKHGWARMGQKNMAEQ